MASKKTDDVRAISKIASLLAEAVIGIDDRRDILAFVAGPDGELWHLNRAKVALRIASVLATLNAADRKRVVEFFRSQLALQGEATTSA